MTGRVGVAISTTGTRPRMLERAEYAWGTAGMMRIHTVYDTEREGVAVTKNRGLQELMDAECEHIFLADDDVYPLHRGSWERYVSDPEPHLMLSWGAHRLLERKDGYAVFSHPRGVMLYFHRSVIEAVGGYRTEFPNFHEHVDLSRRIHQAGLTTHRFADIDRDPREFWYAEDMPKLGETRQMFAARKRRHSTIRRTSAQTRRATELWESLDGDTSFVEYRE